MTTVRIGTRGSPLARWQAACIRDQLFTHDPTYHIDLVPITTTGDRIRGHLAAHGGKALYVQEIEQALCEGTIDLAVHSLKDLPATPAATLAIFGVTEREDPRDCLLARSGGGWQTLPTGARVGTSSLRRQWQLVALQPRCQIEPLRGNVDTRVRKLVAGEYDAIVLAQAGVKRLGLHAPVMVPFGIDEMIPAIGQGVLVVEGRASDLALRSRVLEACNHAMTEVVVAAERAVMVAVGGDCFTPLAAHASIRDGTIHLYAWLATTDGTASTRVAEHAPLHPGDDPCMVATAIGQAVGVALKLQLGRSDSA